MQIILSKNELVELKRVAGISSYITGEVLKVSGLVEKDFETMTEDEIVKDITEDIEAIGGKVERACDCYIVRLPETIVSVEANRVHSLIAVTGPFVLRATEFAVKYKNCFKKIYSYAKVGLETIANTIKLDVDKEAIKRDFAILEDVFEITKLHVNKIINK